MVVPLSLFRWRPTCSKSWSPGDLSRCQLIASIWSLCQTSGKHFCDQLFRINFLRSNLIFFLSLSFLQVGRFAFGALSPHCATCTLWSSLRFRNKLCFMNWTSVSCLHLDPNLNWFLTTVLACIPPSYCVPLWSRIFSRGSCSSTLPFTQFLHHVSNYQRQCDF